MAAGVGIIEWAKRHIGWLPQLGMQEQRRSTLARLFATKCGHELADGPGELGAVLGPGGRVVEMQQLPVGAIPPRVELPARSDDRQRGPLEPPQIMPKDVVGRVWPQQ